MSVGWAIVAVIEVWRTFPASLEPLRNMAICGHSVATRWPQVTDRRSPRAAKRRVSA